MPTSAIFTTREISDWGQIIGNQDLIAQLMGVTNFDEPPKVFLAGPAGSAKSTLVNHICRYLACYEPANNNPCGCCEGCEEFRAMDSDTGLFKMKEHEGITRHYLHINCRYTTPFQILDDLEGIRNDVADSIRVIHLEEAGNLKRLGCDESITGLMDHPDFRTCYWFATAVTDQGLAEQFRRRWEIQARTRRPPAHELALFLTEQCADYGIEIDHPATLEMLAEASYGVVGLALRPLNMALLMDPPMPGPSHQNDAKTAVKHLCFCTAAANSSFSS